MKSLALKTRHERALRIMRALRRLFPQPKIALHFSSNWELLVAVMLSARCTDKKVNEVTRELFKKYRKLDDYLQADLRHFEQDIRATGFYHNKARNILAAARVVKETFDGKPPKTMKEMLTIPGVGRKTANIVLDNAYGIMEGIAVDTHVRRLSQQFGLTKQTDPDKIESDLMHLIPKKDWADLTYLLINYGRTYCPAQRHDHAECPLSKYYV